MSSKVSEAIFRRQINLFACGNYAIAVFASLHRFAQ
jgi:hypothetical protein